MIPINELKRSYELYQTEYDEKALNVLHSGWYILGKEVDSFEKEFADALGEGAKVASVGNGLDAIYLGLRAINIGKNDEVIVQANGYIATILAVIRCGATPVFVEPDSTYNMDASKIEQAITHKTKAVLVTHLYGLATKMNDIIDICKRHKLMLLEDCAQSHFASWNGVNTGIIGDLGFYSFYPTKNLGAFGDGGAVASKNEELINKIKVLRNYGSDYRYHNIEIGCNSRLDEMQAGLLRIKLAHMRELIANRTQYANLYLKKISNQKVKLPQIPNTCTSVWYQFVVEVNDRDAFQYHMNKKGVSTDVNWKTPPYLQPALCNLGYQKGDFPITENICEHIVSLPMMDYMTQEEILAVIEAVNTF